VTPEEIKTYVEQAFPHEAGHILVGRFVGIPINGLDHIVLRGRNNELLPGNFATDSVSPSPGAISITPPNVLEAYLRMIGGGLAGNIVSGVKADEFGIQKDRADLKVVSTKTLEEAAEESRNIIEQNAAVFEKLTDAIKNSYRNLVKDPDIAADRYTLLTSQQLEQICPQNKKLFPPQSYR
jgi:hypothetical protein